MNAAQPTADDREHESPAARTRGSSPFRRDALAHARRASTQVKLPHYAPRPARYVLYALLVVLGVAFAFCALARVPAYVQGGLVTPLPGQHASRSSSPASVLLFPVSFRDHAQTGRRLRVQLLDGQQPVGATLTVTRTQILSPREVTGRFHLAPGQGDTISGPVVVATARPSSATDEQTVSRLGAGTVEPAHARSGSQSLLSLMM